MFKGSVLETRETVNNMKEEVAVCTPEKKSSSIGIFSRLLRFDSLGGKRNSGPESPTTLEPSETYYGVYIPCEIKKGPDEEALHVFKNKSEAFELMKRYKLARFKAFNNRQDAVSFALRGAEPLDPPENNDKSLMGEKPYPFKAPSPQDMVALRKSIEAGLTTVVRNRVWDNPRYLVSSGSTPAILQEGSRYNALHVAAKAGNADICNLILTTVGNPTFIQTLYGSDANMDSCKEFAAILVDRYLNTPDKAMNETPLHFASKFGAQEVVDVLTSFPQCNKEAVNKYGEQAKDIICKRATATVPPSAAPAITRMLHERFYVPVLHTEDDSMAPTIGKPFTPAVPPELNVDPLSPRYEIRAFAGPMTLSDASHFHRRWKTPPRALRPPHFRLADISKGLESVGRNLAEEMRFGWKEYWPFLDTFTDLRTAEGLVLLENYLRSKYETAVSIAFANTINEPEELSISRISIANLSQTNNEMSPMSELCVAMKTCTITDRSPRWIKTDPVRQRMCRQPTKIQNGDFSPVNHSVSQLLCIERTCQVFAKRIADSLVFSLTAEPEVAGDSLKSETKYLQHTIHTYMDDQRFKSIDFALIHSRAAQLVVFNLKQKTNDFDDINHLIEFLVKLRCPNDDIFSSDDERKSNYRCQNRVKLSQIIDSHVRCLASFISEELTENNIIKGPSISDNECTETWDKTSKCRCEWRMELYERNSKKNASFRKNRSSLSSSPKTESFVKRLMFDHDVGDRLDNKDTSPPNVMNSPAGDVPVMYTVDTNNCQVFGGELITDDDSGKSSASEEFYTASELSDDDDMVDASDQALVEAFIYGEEPTKMDRLVYEAISDCSISCEQYPNIYRWRNTISLYPSEDREKWPQASQLEESDGSPVSYSFNLGQAYSHARQRRKEVRQTNERCSTPKKDNGANDSSGRAVNLQVSNWLRVTGPNSPRSSLATKSIGHNVSFGF